MCFTKHVRNILSGQNQPLEGDALIRLNVRRAILSCCWPQVKPYLNYVPIWMDFLYVDIGT